MKTGRYSRPALETDSPRLYRERRSATASRGGIRVLDNELRTFQTFGVIDLSANQILEAHRIDQQLHPVLAHPGVVFIDDFVEREAILEAGAAAAADEHAQLQVGIAFFLDQLLHFIRRAVRKHERV